jgi:hypothetical protein
MIKTEYRAELAAILLAGVLSLLAASAANAGGLTGRAPAEAKAISSNHHQAGGSPGGGVTPKGGRGGMTGGAPAEAKAVSGTHHQAGGPHGGITRQGGRGGMTGEF